MKIKFLRNYERAHKILWKEMKKLFIENPNFFIFDNKIRVSFLKGRSFENIRSKKYINDYIDNYVICSACAFKEKNKLSCDYCPIKMFYNKFHDKNLLFYIPCSSREESPYKKLYDIKVNNENISEVLKLFDEIINLKWKKFIII